MNKIMVIGLVSLLALQSSAGVITSDISVKNGGTVGNQTAQSYALTGTNYTTGTQYAITTTGTVEIAAGGSPSSEFVEWYDRSFKDLYAPTLSQISDGTDLIYCARQDYTNITTRLNMKIPNAITGDVWTVKHHAGPQTGTNVTFDVLYAITRGNTIPTAWTYTNSVTLDYNITNAFDNIIEHTLTNTVAGTNTATLWINKGNSAIGSGYFYWVDTTIEVSR